MKALLLFAVSILILSGQPNGQEWYGFAPYAGARQLCDRTTVSTTGVNAMEIHWRSYATSDARAKVIAFYEKTKVKDVEKSSEEAAFKLDKDTTLSVHAATASGYPKCDSKPRADEKTVIVVSRATRR